MVSIFLALISGLFVDKFPKNRILAVVGMIIGMAVTYIFGTEWLAIQLKMSFVAALSVGVIPYLAGDAVKIIIAIIVGLCTPQPSEPAAVIKIHSIGINLGFNSGRLWIPEPNKAWKGVPVQVPSAGQF